MQALAASLNKIAARHLRTEHANVSLLYVSGVGALGSLAACVLVPGSLQQPDSGPVYGLLTANGEAVHGQVCEGGTHGPPAAHVQTSALLGQLPQSPASSNDLTPRASQLRVRT